MASCPDEGRVAFGFLPLVAISLFLVLIDWVRDHISEHLGLILAVATVGLVTYSFLDFVYGKGRWKR